MDRRHFLISFSREIAERMLAWGSNQTSLLTLYLFVKPGSIFLLVLADAESQVAGHTEGENAGLAGHEVNVEGTLHAGGIVTEET